MAAEALTSIQVPGLPLLATGKVRSLYAVSPSSLLFVASDRISAYDVVMENGIPNKGRILTLMSHFWFTYLSSKIPSLKTHFLTLDLPDQVPESLTSTLAGRSMQVRKLKVLPIEAIVRGYITGSAWKEYQKAGTVHGIAVPSGLVESQAFEKPIYTPSTKAEAGKNDENIHPSKAAEIVGQKYAARIEELALSLYETARAYAAERGIIIADTKFEFGVDEDTDEVVLVDEVLTPDSSRFWPAKEYASGKGQDSFDKQYLRDFLTAHGLKGKQGTRVPDEIVSGTLSKYEEAFEKLVGKTWQDYAASI